MTEEFHFNITSKKYRGKSPKRPRTMELGVFEILTETEKWLRRYEVAWFPMGSYPTFEMGYVDIGDIDNVIHNCDVAVERVSLLSKYASEIANKLKKLKSEATKHRLNLAKTAASQKGRGRKSDMSRKSKSKR